MYYAFLVILTLLQTIVANQIMDLSVFEMRPYTIRLWSNYLVAAMVLWSPMLFTRKRRWTYVVSLLLDIWFIGNLMYFRSYGDVLNRWCLQNVSNLDGIWSSILPFLRWGDLLFPCVTILWIAFSITHLANETINLIAHREGEVTPVSSGEIDQFIETPHNVPEQGNLLLILFESLEDWTIGLEMMGKK